MPFDGLTIRRVLPSSPARVFAAWTRPELMARWFFPGRDWTTTVTADVRVGGAYDLAMREPGGRVHRQFGVYREIVAPSRLVFTWSCPDLAIVDSVVTVALAAHADGTELVLTHELPDDAAIRGEHAEGWDACLGNLEILITQHGEALS